MERDKLSIRRHTEVRDYTVVRIDPTTVDVRRSLQSPRRRRRGAAHSPSPSRLPREGASRARDPMSHNIATGRSRLGSDVIPFSNTDDRRLTHLPSQSQAPAALVTERTRRSLVMARSALRNPEEVTSNAPTPASISDTATVILFDFDGTLGDTETPAMIVAFWELAPYFPEASVEYLSEQRMKTYVRDNAGKAFEFMVDVVEEDRKKAGLPSVEAVRTAGSEDPAVLAHVNAERAKSGLPTIEATRALNVDLLTLQKDETVEALATLAKPCPNVPDVLAQLKSKGYDFSIATTSGKPRVPVSVVACKYEAYFPPEKIHSGESDFEPPRFKPDPSVYLVSLF